MNDPYFELLPSLLSSREVVTDAYAIQQMHTKQQVKYREGIKNAAESPVTDGDGIVVLVSSDKDKVFSQAELDENMYGANRLIRNLGNFGIGGIELVSDFSRADVEKVIQDQNIGHMIFIGHSKRPAVYSPGENIFWNNTEPFDHLKKSLGVLGCAVDNRAGATPRFGYNLIHPVTGILYGKTHGDTRASEFSDLGNYARLSPRMLDDAAYTSHAA